MATPALLRAGVLLTALATSAAATFGSGIEPWELGPWLARHGGLGLALALGWLVLAPLPLGVGTALVRRTPWPWVLAVTAHLLVPVVLLARFPHLLPGWAWGVVALSVALGLASVATAFPAPGGRRGS